MIFGFCRWSWEGQSPSALHLTLCSQCVWQGWWSRSASSVDCILIYSRHWTEIEIWIRRERRRGSQLRLVMVSPSLDGNQEVMYQWNTELGGAASRWFERCGQSVQGIWGRKGKSHRTKVRKGYWIPCLLSHVLPQRCQLLLRDSSTLVDRFLHTCQLCGER